MKSLLSFLVLLLSLSILAFAASAPTGLTVSGSGILLSSTQGQIVAGDTNGNYYGAVIYTSTATTYDGGQGGLHHFTNGDMITDGLFQVANYIYTGTSVACYLGYDGAAGFAGGLAQIDPSGNLVVNSISSSTSIYADYINGSGLMNYLGGIGNAGASAGDAYFSSVIANALAPNNGIGGGISLNNNLITSLDGYVFTYTGVYGQPPNISDSNGIVLISFRGSDPGNGVTAKVTGAQLQNTIAVLTGTLASGTCTIKNALVSGTKAWAQNIGTTGTFGDLSMSISGTTATIRSTVTTGTVQIFIAP